MRPTTNVQNICKLHSFIKEQSILNEKISSII